VLRLAWGVGLQAQQLKSMARSQKKRTRRIAAGHQWALSHNRLEQERERAEQDMLAAMRAASGQRTALGADMESLLGSYRDDASVMDREKVRTRIYVMKLRQEFQGNMCARDVTAFRARLDEAQESSAETCRELEALSAALSHDLRQVEEFLVERQSKISSDLEGPALQLNILLQKFPLADAHVKRAVSHELERLQTDLGRAMDTWNASCKSACQAKSQNDWPASMTQKLTSCRAEAHRLVGAKGRDAVLSHMASMLPSCSLHEILHFERWFLLRKLMLDRRRNIELSFSRRRAETLQESEALLTASSETNEQNAEMAAERLQTEARRQNLHSKLKDMRVERAIEHDVKSFMKNAEDRKRGKLAAASAMREKRKRVQVKKLIAVYQRSLETKRQKEEEALRLKEEKERQELGHILEYCSHRVEFRRQQNERRREEKASGAALVKLRQEQQRERLERLASQVAPQVEADPERVLQATASSSGQGEAEQVGNRLFNPMNGFSDNHLFKDKRFRLSEALREANLHTTDHGRAIIRQAQTSTAPRVDTFSSAQLGLPGRLDPS